MAPQRGRGSAGELHWCRLDRHQLERRGPVLRRLDRSEEVTAKPMTDKELNDIETHAAKSIGRVADVKAIHKLVAEVRRLKAALDLASDHGKSI